MVGTKGRMYVAWLALLFVVGATCVAAVPSVAIDRSILGVQRAEECSSTNELRRNAPQCNDKDVVFSSSTGWAPSAGGCASSAVTRVEVPGLVQVDYPAGCAMTVKADVGVSGTNQCEGFLMVLEAFLEQQVPFLARVKDLGLVDITTDLLQGPEDVLLGRELRARGDGASNCDKLPLDDDEVYYFADLTFTNELQLDFPVLEKLPPVVRNLVDAQNSGGSVGEVIPGEATEFAGERVCIATSVCGGWDDGFALHIDRQGKIAEVLTIPLFPPFLTFKPLGIAYSFKGRFGQESETRYWSGRSNFVVLLPNVNFWIRGRILGGLEFFDDSQSGFTVGAELMVELALDRESLLAETVEGTSMTITTYRGGDEVYKFELPSPKSGIFLRHTEPAQDECSPRGVFATLDSGGFNFKMGGSGGVLKDMLGDQTLAVTQDFAVLWDDRNLRAFSWRLSLTCKIFNALDINGNILLEILNPDEIQLRTSSDLSGCGTSPALEGYDDPFKQKIAAAFGSTGAILFSVGTTDTCLDLKALSLLSLKVESCGFFYAIGFGGDFLTRIAARITVASLASVAGVLELGFGAQSGRVSGSVDLAVIVLGLPATAEISVDGQLTDPWTAWNWQINMPNIPLKKLVPEEIVDAVDRAGESVKEEKDNLFNYLADREESFRKGAEAFVGAIGEIAECSVELVESFFELRQPQCNLDNFESLWKQLFEVNPENLEAYFADKFKSVLKTGCEWVKNLIPSSREILSPPVEIGRDEFGCRQWEVYEYVDTCDKFLAILSGGLSCLYRGKPCKEVIRIDKDPACGEDHALKYKNAEDMYEQMKDAQLNLASFEATAAKDLEFFGLSPEEKLKIIEENTDCEYTSAKVGANNQITVQVECKTVRFISRTELVEVSFSRTDIVDATNDATLRASEERIVTKTNMEAAAKFSGEFYNPVPPLEEPREKVQPVLERPRDIEVPCTSSLARVTTRVAVVDVECQGGNPIGATDELLEDDGCGEEKIRRTFRYTDACGQVADPVQMIITKKAVGVSAPERIAPQMFACEEPVADGYNAPATIFDLNSVNAPCSDDLSVSYSDSDIRFVCSGQGIKGWNVPRLYTIEDECDQTDTTNQLVVRTDYDEPEWVSVPKIQIVSCRADISTASLGLPMAEDNCDPLEVTASLLTYNDDDRMQPPCPIGFYRAFEVADRVCNANQAVQRIEAFRFEFRRDVISAKAPKASDVHQRYPQAFYDATSLLPTFTVEKIKKGKPSLQIFRLEGVYDAVLNEPSMTCNFTFEGLTSAEQEQQALSVDFLNVDDNVDLGVAGLGDGVGRWDALPYEGISWPDALQLIGEGGRTYLRVKLFPAEFAVLHEYIGQYSYDRGGMMVRAPTICVSQANVTYEDYIAFTLVTVL
ncbi:hypothetical protein FVE85_4328 [Porphyridium purpureum]|uniref:Uncharacterized protein n=1 Tax=Porphyridium purpureum TaxID=35688 RepID=A0A5J4YUB7_PORPP|nr:hypothetical protein FVE85_4328 [Porphyridium purpureum]|eukprot:POR6226..scf229_5